MQLDEKPGPELTTSQDDPYLMMNHEKRSQMRAAMKRMQRYCDAHPESPSATRRPQLLVRGGVWVALLGRSIPEGIAGFGYTVEAALRAFDAQYGTNADGVSPLPSNESAQLLRQ
jgi:hypothetical protein